MKMCKARDMTTLRWFTGLGFTAPLMSEDFGITLSMEDGTRLQANRQNVELIEFDVVTEEEQARADAIAAEFFATLLG